MEIQKLKNGDKEAFKELVLEYQDRIYNLCYGFLHNEADALDVTQDVFLEIYRSIRAFRGDSNLFTWVYRIAIMKSLEALRKRKRKKWLKMIFGNPGQDIIENLQDPSPIADEKVEVERQIRLLFASMEKLPENQKIALCLKCMEGLGIKEVGEIMGISIKAVEALLSRARKNLRKRLEKKLSEGFPALVASNYKRRDNT